MIAATPQNATSNRLKKFPERHIKYAIEKLGCDKPKCILSMLEADGFQQESKFLKKKKGETKKKCMDLEMQIDGLKKRNAELEARMHSGKTVEELETKCKVSEKEIEELHKKIAELETSWKNCEKQGFEQKKIIGLEARCKNVEKERDDLRKMNAESEARCTGCVSQNDAMKKMVAELEAAGVVQAEKCANLEAKCGAFQHKLSEAEEFTRQCISTVADNADELKLLNSAYNKLNDEHRELSQKYDRVCVENDRLLGVQMRGMNKTSSSTACQDPVTPTTQEQQTLETHVESKKKCDVSASAKNANPVKRNGNGESTKTKSNANLAQCNPSPAKKPRLQLVPAEKGPADGNGKIEQNAQQNATKHIGQALAKNPNAVKHVGRAMAKFIASKNIAPLDLDGIIDAMNKQHFESANKPNDNGKPMATPSPPIKMPKDGNTSPPAGSAIASHQPSSTSSSRSIVVNEKALGKRPTDDANALRWITTIKEALASEFRQYLPQSGTLRSLSLDFVTVPAAVQSFLMQARIQMAGWKKEERQMVKRRLAGIARELLAKVPKEEENGKKE